MWVITSMAGSGFGGCHSTNHRLPAATGACSLRVVLPAAGCVHYACWQYRLRWSAKRPDCTAASRNHIVICRHLAVQARQWMHQQAPCLTLAEVKRPALQHVVHIA